MALPASAVERKKAEANENTFVTKPPLRKRFPAPEVRDIIRAVFREQLAGEPVAAAAAGGGGARGGGGAAASAAAASSGAEGKDAKGDAIKYSSDLAKDVADAIRNRIKALDLPRYKILVHVVVGENRGEGVRAGTRCLWDTTTDAVVHESYISDALFAVATAYGVYLY